MRRSLLFLLFLATGHLTYSAPPIPTASLESSYFSGLNLGVSAGLTSINNHHYGFTSFGNENENHAYGSTGFSTAFSSSFLYPLSTRWLLGPEFHIQYNPTSIINTGPYASKPGLVLAKYSLFWNGGFAAKLGYAIHHSNLLYVLAGPELATIQSNYIESQPNSTGSHTTAVFGAVIAIGFDQKITQHIYFGEQLSYGWFGSNTTKLTAGEVKKDYPNILAALIYCGIKI